MIVGNWVIAQISITIDTIHVSEYNIDYQKIDKSNWGDERLENGPFFVFCCKIINNNNVPFEFAIYDKNRLVKSPCSLSFRYNGKQFIHKVPIYISDNEIDIKIAPNDTTMVKIADYPIVGALGVAYNKLDFTNELLQILPTIQILYDNSYIKFESNGIKNVVLHEYDYSIWE